MSTCGCYIATLDYWKLPAHQQRWKQKNTAKLEENKQVFLQAPWSHTMIQWWLEGDRAIFDCKTTEKKKANTWGSSLIPHTAPFLRWVHGFTWMALFGCSYHPMSISWIFVFLYTPYPTMPIPFEEVVTHLATWYVFCAASTHDNWC